MGAAVGAIMGGIVSTIGAIFDLNAKQKALEEQRRLVHEEIIKLIGLPPTLLDWYFWHFNAYCQAANGGSWLIDDMAYHDTITPELIHDLVLHNWFNQNKGLMLSGSAIHWPPLAANGLDIIRNSWSIEQIPLLDQNWIFKRPDWSKQGIENRGGAESVNAKIKRGLFKHLTYKYQQWQKKGDYRLHVEYPDHGLLYDTIYVPSFIKEQFRNNEVSTKEQVNQAVSLSFKLPFYPNNYAGKPSKLLELQTALNRRIL